MAVENAEMFTKNKLTSEKQMLNNKFELFIIHSVIILKNTNRGSKSPSFNVCTRRILYGCNLWTICHENRKVT